MPNRNFALSRLITLAAFAALTTAAQEYLVVISNAASPQVAYGVTHANDSLSLVVAVAHFDPAKKTPGISVQLGLVADHEIRLSEKDARVQTADGQSTFTFNVADAKLVADKEGWERLRIGLAIEWPGGPLGQPRQRESFLQGKTLAPHGGLGASENWQRVNLAEFEKTIADRRLQIAFEFDQPLEGKATIVIEDEKGQRVRNLLSGQPLPKGKQRIVWDGANDKGDLMPPGKYQWRALSHPGLKPNYLFSFCNGPGSNHGTFHAAATNGKDLFFGTPVSEGGHQLVQLDQNGAMLRGFNAPNGIGLGRVAVAADAKYLYAAYDGSSWGTHIDR